MTIVDSDKKKKLVSPKVGEVDSDKKKKVLSPKVGEEAVPS